MPEEKAARTPAAAETAEKSKSPVILMAAGSLLMVGLAYAGVHFVLSPLVHPNPAAAKAEPHGEEASAKGEKGEIVRFEGIIVNPSGTMGSRYLSTTVGLEVADEASRAAVTEAEPMIKDALITHLSSRTIDELTDPAAREQMRSAIRDLVNARIAPHHVSAVFFLDFVLQ
jgi:flagellar FliL protein